MKLGTNVSLSLQTAKQPMPNSTLAICRVMSTVYRMNIL